MDSIFQVQSKLRADLGLTKVPAIPNPNYKAHGTKSYVSLMNRFGFRNTKSGRYFHQKTLHQRGMSGGSAPAGGRIRFHTTLMKSDADGKPSQVTAEDQQNDSMWICEVQIGTPAQTLKLDFDTGSGDLWVFSTELDKESQGTGHTLFDPSKSSTHKKCPGQAWQIQYGDGSTASGDVVTDDISIGGLKIRKQSVELAKKLAPQFSQGTGDGLLGLAFPQINTITTDDHPDPQPTPVANMISQNDIPKNAELFTSAFYSCKDQAAKSFYTFGWIDQDLVKASGEDIAWTDVDSSQGFWTFPSPSVKINGKEMLLDGNTAIADTGTTLALVSDEVCKALYDAIEGSSYSQEYQGYIIPNDVTAAGLPDFSVSVGNKHFTIQKEDLLFAPADSNNWYGGVQSRGDNNFDILGGTFLKSIYAIWDQGNSRFGAVPKLEKTQNVEPPKSSNGGESDKGHGTL